jgi:hypothetical protein
MNKPTTWTVQKHRDTLTRSEVEAYQARGVLPADPQAKPAPRLAPVIAQALGPWHYVAEHGDEGARKLAEADGAASGLPRADD